MSMRGEFYRLFLMTAAAKSALSGGAFNYSDSKSHSGEDFECVIHPDNKIDEVNETLVKSPREWFKYLRETGLCDVKFIPLTMFSPPELYGYEYNTGGEILCVFENGKQSLFAPKWEHDSDYQYRRLRYFETIPEKPREIPPCSDNTDELRQVLIEFGELASKTGYDKIAERFGGARKVLDGESKPDMEIVRHVPNIPTQNLPLFCAAAEADVFGLRGFGASLEIGSMRTSAISRNLINEYDELTDRLIKNISLAFQFSVNNWQ